MFDYLLVLAGEAPRKKMEPKYKPHHNSIADTNLAIKYVKKKTMPHMRVIIAS